MVKVKVEQGWLEGETLLSSTGEGSYESFKGIPYATPPLGKLRFKAPLPAQPWDGVKQAKKHGAVCPQKDLFTNQVLPGNEDCLYLNVYTPTVKPSSPLAVMVFIHGGAFMSGSGDEDNYGPDFLMAHSVVLVTINYRLEVLGFLCLDTEEVPGNAGLKDQVLALKWVKQNISNFGGDPSNITVFGESAGGASAAYHILSPMSKGLFKRCIPMSGVPFCDWALPFEARRRAFALGKQLGKDTNDPNELLEFFQSLPAEKFVNVQPCVIASEEVTTKTYKIFTFTPVVEKVFADNNFITESPMQILKSGKFNDVDVLLGHTSMEALIVLPMFDTQPMKKYYNKYPDLLVPVTITQETSSKTVLEIADKISQHYFAGKPVSVNTIKEYVAFSMDSTYVYDIYRFLKLLAKSSKNKIYQYRFSCVSDRNIYGQVGKRYGLNGASHMDDMMYLFDAKHTVIAPGEKERKLINLVCTLFTNFAKFGTMSTSTSGVEWPEYGDGEYYGDIADEVSIGQHLNADIISFWKSVFDQAGLEFM